jgi:hypothetical protein
MDRTVDLWRLARQGRADSAYPRRGAYSFLMNTRLLRERL